MTVVGVLTQQRDGGLRVVWVELRHVQVIDEVDQAALTLRTELTTSFLLERLLELSLQVSGVGVVVEVDQLE